MDRLDSSVSPACRWKYITHVHETCNLTFPVLTGPLYDAGYFRTLVCTGTFFIVFGFMMTSLARQYWSVLLAQGFLVGIGNGCLFVPSVAILPSYFTTRKALANGLASSGSSVGGIVLPICFRALQQRIGFGWATRSIAFIALGTLAFSIAIMRQRKLPAQKRKLSWDISAFKEVPYLLYCMAMFLAFASFYTFIYFVQPYAIQTGIVDVSFGFYLLPILNAASVPGRILPNAIGDYIGPMNVLIPASLFTGVLALAWIAVKTRASIIAVACLYGFFSGAFVSISPIALVVLTKDMSRLGERMGMSFCFTSVGLLFGTPVAGAILDRTGWLGPQLFSGLLLIATALMFLASRVSHSGWGLFVKA